MAGTYLCDTNAAIALIKGETRPLELIDTADEVFASTVTVGELYFGAEKSAKVKNNRATVDKFIESVEVLLCDVNTSRHYGKIKQQLKSKGRPIPDNDIWIAALAIQHDLTLLTRDAHFAEVAGLAIQGW